MVTVFITLDTEHSIGGAFRDPSLKPVGNEKRIFGRIGDKYYGIPLIMDIADEYGIPLTFFVEVMNKYYFGPDETRKVVEYILKRGHDVQLHIHPNYLSYSHGQATRKIYSDFISSYDLEDQLSIIEEGKFLLERYGVSKVVAFRAGGFHANETTLKALSKLGIISDSSYNRAKIGTFCQLPNIAINDLQKMNGIWEIPITNFIQRRKIIFSGYRAMDLNGVSSQEMKYIFRSALIYGPKAVTILLHSFSFIKPYNVQYTKVRPRKNVIRRFENLCKFLAQYPNRFCVLTLGSLNAEKLEAMAQQSVHHFPKVPPILSLKRNLSQLIDRIV